MAAAVWAAVVKAVEAAMEEVDSVLGAMVVVG
jgi:hypothetical protein